MEVSDVAWRKRGGMVFLVLLLAGSVGLWLASKAELPTVEIRQVSVQVPVNNRATVQVQVAVSNPLGVPLNYLGADYKIAVGEVVLVQGKLDLEGTVAARAKSVLLLPLTVDLSRLEAARQAGKRGAPATISGGVHVYLGKQRETIPFAFKRRLAFGGAGVTSQVTSAQIHLLERGRVRVKAALELTNPLDQVLHSAGTDYRVLLDKKEVARGSFKTTAQIPAKGKGPLELSVDINLPSDGAQRPRSLTVLATVKASLGGRPLRVPLRLHKELSALPSSSSCTAREVSLGHKDDGTLGVLLTLGCRGDFARKMRSATVRYRAMLNGAEMASGTVTARKIRNDATGLTVEAPLTVHLDKLRKARAAGGPMELKVAGLVIARMEERTLRLPFELNKKLSPGGMRCQLLELSVSSWGGKLRLAPRLRITSSAPLPAVDSMEVTYAVTLDGLPLGSGSARVAGHGDKKQLLARAELLLDQARLRALGKGGDAARVLRMTGLVMLQAKGKTHQVPYSFTRPFRPGGKSMSVRLQRVSVKSPSKDRLVLYARLGVRSRMAQTLRNISASYSVHVQGARLLEGTFRLAALGGGRTGHARVRVQMDPARLRALQGKAVGKRVALLIRGVLTASLPGQKAPLRVPFVVARSLRPAQGSMAVTVESVQVHALSGGGLRGTVKLGLEGGAAGKLGKLRATYEVLARDRKLIKGELALEAASPGRWTATIPVTITTDSLAALRKEGFVTVPLKITGRVTARPRGRGEVVFPFSVTRRLQLGGPRPLAVSVKSLVLDATSPGKLKVNLVLALRSRLQMDLADLDAAYTVTAGGKVLLRGSFLLKRLLAGKTGEARIPLTVQTDALKALKKGSAGGTGALKITGKVSGKILSGGNKPRSFDLPFTIRKELGPAGKPLSAEVLGVWIKEISAAQVRLLLKLRLRGGVFESAQNVKATFKVEAQGQQVLTGKLKLGAPGAGKSVIAELPLTVKAARMRAIKKKNKGKKIILQISGKVTAATAQGVLSIPFVVHKEAALLDRPLAVKLHKLDFSGMSFRNRTFRAIINITNKAPFTIKNLNIEGTLTLAKGVQGRVLNRNVTLRSGQTTRLTIAVKAERGGILRLIAQKFRSKRAKSRMRLKISGKTEDGTTITTSEDRGDTVDVKR